jgi:CubicO group peptidase (beta-lactamase class C family)
MRRHSYLPITLAFAVLLPHLAPADQIDDIVRTEIAAQKLPGVTIAVVKNGKVVKLKGYGEANIELHVPATKDTVYQSGSVGKQFTATLVMMLIQDGKLGLDDSISRWFPEGGEAWKPVTIRHLLSHTSGLADMPYDKMDLTKTYTEDDLVKLMASEKPVEAPGTKWRYNNGGYVMLGVLVHRLTGKFYGDLLQERIFKPLGMTTARIISEADIVPNRAAGYDLTKNGLKNQAWVSPSLNTTADGSLYLTALDYVKWDAGLRTERLLPKAARSKERWLRLRLGASRRPGPPVNRARRRLARLHNLYRSNAGHG